MIKGQGYDSKWDFITNTKCKFINECHHKEKWIIFNVYYRLCTSILFGLLISGISSCLTSLNFWITILNLRSYYLTLKTIPLFPWAFLITAFMLLLTLPILSGTLILILGDLHSNTLFFDPIFGGDPIFYQHLFWFFGHPEVYILIIPAFGIISMETY